MLVMPMLELPFTRENAANILCRFLRPTSRWERNGLFRPVVFAESLEALQIGFLLFHGGVIVEDLVVGVAWGAAFACAGCHCGDRGADVGDVGPPMGGAAGLCDGEFRYEGHDGSGVFGWVLHQRV